MSGIRFRVSESDHDGQFYARMAAANSEIIWQSEGYRRAASAHKVCRTTWEAIGKAIDPGHVLQWPPTPYAKDSLLPRARRPS